MLINQQNLRSMYTGFQTVFNQAFAGVTPQWSRVATLVPSNKKTEDYGWLGEFPSLKEWVGDRQVKNIAASGYSIRNKPYESTIAVDRDDIEDDAFGQFTPVLAGMGYAAAVHPDELVFGLIKSGFSTTCFDGQYFFDTDHPVGDSSVSNFGGGSGAAWYLLDTSRPLKPLIYQKRKDYQLLSLTDPKDEAVFMQKKFRYGVDGRGNVGFGFWQMAYASKQDLTADNLEAAIAAMSSFKSDEGRPLGIKPTVLLVPPTLRSKAFRLLKAETIEGTTNVNANVAEPIVVPWLA